MDSIGSATSAELETTQVHGNMRNLKRYEKQPLKLPVNSGVVALVGLMAAVVCFLAFAFTCSLFWKLTSTA
jgi:hypothetical protein